MKLFQHGIRLFIWNHIFYKPFQIWVNRWHLHQLCHPLKFFPIWDILATCCFFIFRTPRFWFFRWFWIKCVKIVAWRFRFLIFIKQRSFIFINFFIFSSRGLSHIIKHFWPKLDIFCFNLIFVEKHVWWKS